MVTWLRAIQMQELFDEVFGMEIGKNDRRKSSDGPNQGKSDIIYISLPAFLRNSKPAAISDSGNSCKTKKNVHFGGSCFPRYDSVVWVTIDVSIVRYHNR